LPSVANGFGGGAPDIDSGIRMRLLARDLAKSYGQTQAVAGVSINLEPGTVHALVGENGAGKSTTLRMLAGVERPDHGEMTLDGKAYTPNGSSDAAGHGVALVFQEITINRSLTIAENIFIDRLRQFSGRLGLINSRRVNQAAQTILDRLHLEISVSSDLERLNLGQWKCIEIARALSTDPKVLLLDESTAYLDHREVELVLDAIRRLKEQGITIAFVSHHLDEVRAVADHLTILKDGRQVGTFATEEISPDEIHRQMVGRDLSQGIYPARSTAAINAEAQTAIFEVQRVGLGQELIDASFEVHAGEVLGLAGLKGSGADGLFSVIAGDKPRTTGNMHLAGSSYEPATPADAWRAGVAYLPGDRTGEGLITEFSVLENLLMAGFPRWGPFFDRSAAVGRARTLISRIGIKTASVDSPCRALSGGNMQKVVIGKCLAIGPKLLLLNNPTRGVDVGARLEIYRLIRDLVDSGLAVILSSEDMPELIGMADRLLVFRSGRIVHQFTNAAATAEHEIVRHMT
jgi:ABC-type sugar transport system ATPase subunit